MAKKDRDLRYDELDRRIGHAAGARMMMDDSKEMIRAATRSRADTDYIIHRSQEIIEVSRRKLRRGATDK